MKLWVNLRPSLSFFFFYNKKTKLLCDSSTNCEAEKGMNIFWSQTNLYLLPTVWIVWMFLRGLRINECRWWRGAGTPPNPAECTGMGNVGGCKEKDGWTEGCWRDDGERLNGSTWQLIERGSRVATPCNLLAGPWCMQAWYQQARQTHARKRERAVRRDKLVFS